MSESRVGSKGELFPPKGIRARLGLKPRLKVIYRIEGGRLLVEPVPKLEDVLSESTSVEITLEEFHDFRKKLSQKASSLKQEAHDTLGMGSSLPKNQERRVLRRMLRSFDL